MNQKLLRKKDEKKEDKELEKQSYKNQGKCKVNLFIKKNADKKMQKKEERKIAERKEMRGNGQKYFTTKKDENLGKM